MKKTLTFAFVVFISAALSGCLHDNSVTQTNNNSNSVCWAILQTTTDYGNIGNTFSTTNLTYDSDCRPIVSETNGNQYSNTSYDLDGNIETIEIVTSIDQGATWGQSLITNYTYSGGLLMQTEWYGLTTNYTYDSDDRVIVEEKWGATYMNTTYNSDGNIETTEIVTSIDQGATWGESLITNYTYSGGLLMQTEWYGLTTNYTYDSDDRVIVVESMGTGYTNTSYDSDGNIAVVETTITVNQGATWTHTFQTNLWGEP